MAKVFPMPLTETPVQGSVSDEYFYRMLSPYALKLAAPYSEEENKVLEKCLQTCPIIQDMNFVAVGGGELWELRRAAKYTKNYVCIEPLADIFVNDSVRYLIEQQRNISLIPKRFGEVLRSDLPAGRSFVMFLFNILAYINNPITAINGIVQQGDILFITTWADTVEARRTRLAYFDYLNSCEEGIIIDPEQNIGLSHLDHFPFDSLTHYKRHERIKGKVTDTLIIYT